ncbi:membrane protein insertion efficiency factor YidD [bacterium]|nr:membrane protein insertion efficiency factor YidD [bacterium]
MLSTIIISTIRVYQKFISPLTGNSCRFYPTCSDYAKEAITTHGLIFGSMLTSKRLIKCGPWHSGGIDTVPDKGNSF